MRVSIFSKVTKVALFLACVGSIWEIAALPARAYLDEPEIDNETQKVGSATSVWSCGFVDKEGKPVIEAKYDGCKRFSEGLAPVCLKGKWGFVDTSGVLKIPMQFDDANPFSDGLAAVQMRNKWGFIDRSGKSVIAPKFFSVKKFSESAAFVELVENKWACIDKTGKTLFDLDANVSSVDDFKEGLALVHRSSTAEFRNKKGEKVFAEFERHSLPFSEKLACVSVSPNGWNYSYGFIDSAGKVVVEPKYARAGSFSEGLACVCVHEGEQEMLPKYPLGKWGYISQTGTVAIAPAFEDAGNFHDGMALILVGEQGLCGYINAKGETVIPAKYIRGFDFSDGLALVREDTTWKYLDKAGKVVITSDGYLCANFHDGRAMVAKLKDSSVLKNAGAENYKFPMPIHHQYDEND